MAKVGGQIYINLFFMYIEKINIALLQMAGETVQMPGVTQSCVLHPPHPQETVAAANT